MFLHDFKAAILYQNIPPGVEFFFTNQANTFFWINLCVTVHVRETFYVYYDNVLLHIIYRWHVPSASAAAMRGRLFHSAALNSNCEKQIKTNWQSSEWTFKNKICYTNSLIHVNLEINAITQVEWTQMRDLYCIFDCLQFSMSCDQGRRVADKVLKKHQMLLILIMMMKMMIMNLQFTLILIYC